MRIDRLLSSIPFNPTPGALDSGGADSTTGELDAARMLTQARHSAAARVEGARERQTHAQVAHAGALAQFGKEAAGLAGTVVSWIRRQSEREAVRGRATATENHTVALEREKTATVRSAMETAEPDGNGLASGVGDMLGQLLSDRLDGIADPHVREQVEARFNAGKPLDESAVQLLEAQRRNAFHRQELTKRIADRGQRAVQSLSAVEQTRLLDDVGSDIRTQVALGTLTPQEGEIRLRAVRDRVRTGIIQAWSQRDPGKAVELLDDKRFDHLFDDDDEKAETRKALVAVREGLSGDAVGEASLELAIEADLRSREVGQDGDPALRDRIAATGDRARLADFEESVRTARRANEFASEIRFLGADEVFTRYESALREAGEDVGLRKGVQRAYMRVERSWADDPAKMAALHPLAKTPQMRIAIQKVRGVASPSLYTRDEAAAVVQRVSESDPRTRRAVLMEFRQQSADHLDLAIRDLEQAGLSASDHLSLMAADDPASGPLLSRIDELRGQSVRELKHSTDPIRAEEFDAEIERGLAPYLDSLAGRGATGDASRQLADDYLALTRKLALSLADQGLPLSRAANAAVEQLVGRRYAFSGGMRVPRRYDAGIVAEHASRLLQDDNSSFVPDPAMSEVDLGAEQSVATWRNSLSESARFVTLADDERAMLVTAEGAPVRNEAGETLTFRFADALPSDPSRLGPRRLQR